MTIKILQDGNVFYNDETANVVFTSSIVVKDGDVRAAILACNEFLIAVEQQRVFGKGNPVTIEFVGP